jgi:AraC-like DNA-binding protein
VSWFSASFAAEIPESSASQKNWKRVCERFGVASPPRERRINRSSMSCVGAWRTATVRNGVAVSEAAVLLGFSHASAFDRAFRRWYGKSPLQHRR